MRLLIHLDVGVELVLKVGVYLIMRVCEGCFGIFLFQSNTSPCCLVINTRHLSQTETFLWINIEICQAWLHNRWREWQPAAETAFHHKSLLHDLNPAERRETQAEEARRVSPSTSERAGKNNQNRTGTPGSDTMKCAEIIHVTV